MALFKSKPKDSGVDLSQLTLPTHVGIIMDGNGRWAKKRGLPRSAGHTAGAQVFRKITRYCSNIGIKYLTVYAFSTENWTRPSDEVSALIRLFKSYLEEALEDFRDDSIVIHFIGDRTAFPKELIELMDDNEEISKDREGMVLNIAMNYGGRDEIIRAVKDLGASDSRRYFHRRNKRADDIRSSLHPRPAGSRPDYPSVGRTPHLEFPVVAVRLRGVCHHGYPVARLQRVRP